MEIWLSACHQVALKKIHGIHTSVTKLSTRGVRTPFCLVAGLAWEMLFHSSIFLWLYTFLYLYSVSLGRANCWKENVTFILTILKSSLWYFTHLKHLLSEQYNWFQLTLNFFNKMTLIITPVIPWCLIRGAGYDDYPCDLAIFSLQCLCLFRKRNYANNTFLFHFWFYTKDTCYLLHTKISQFILAANRYLFRCAQYFSRETLSK